jgi:N-glycosylase/DNA lyase
LLRDHGYRFPNTRARFITTARQYKNEIKDILITKKGDQRRIWLVQHINGFGYKEASHFLRNIGYFNYAIIDTHIIKVLNKSSIDISSKTLTYKTYICIEEILRHIAEKVDLSLGELDLYLWYMETRTILK